MKLHAKLGISRPFSFGQEDSIRFSILFSLKSPGSVSNFDPEATICRGPLDKATCQIWQP